MQQSLCERGMLVKPPQCAAGFENLHSVHVHGACAPVFLGAATGHAQCHMALGWCFVAGSCVKSRQTAWMIAAGNGLWQ